MRTGRAARRSRRREESGFALLLVFLMGAIIAINLYMELPRLAFQAQRQKEQMLMERGEQYKRAIGLFLRGNKMTRWPASIDELESFNNRRFLRRRYIDPLTGKDEWRLIHISNGVLTDSVTNKKKDQDSDHLAKNGSVMELAGLAGADSSTGPGINAVNRRRASDGGAPPVGPDGQPIAQTGSFPPGGFGNPPPSFGTTTPPLPGVSGATGPTTGFNGVAGGGPPPLGGAANISGLLGIPTAPTGPAGNSSTTATYGVGNGIPSVGGGTPIQTIPGALPGNLSGGIQGGITSPFGGQPGAGGVNVNPQAQAAAANLIQGLLTQPRPGGMQGLPQQGGAVMGNGIAGVASKAEGDSIMVYADHTNYGEWEFIYDPMKFAAPQNPNTGSGVGTPASQLSSSTTGPGVINQVGTPASNLPGGIGGMGTAGGIGGAGGIGAPGGTGSPNTGGTAAAGGASPGGGSSAFGQAGPPDIRPGKQ